MLRSPLPFVSAVVCSLGFSLTGCATSPQSYGDDTIEGAPHSDEHGGEHAGDEHAGDDVNRRSHDHKFVKPENFVAKWNAKERDAYQKPQEIVDAMRIAPGAHVVDLGTGTGYLLPFLSKAVGDDGRVLAADVEEKMLIFLDAEIKKNSWSNVVTHLTPRDDPNLLSEAPVTSVVTLNVWHHIDNRGVYARKLYESMGDGGTFVVVDFLPVKTEGFGPPVKMRLKAEQVVADLVAGGFKAEVVEESMPRHYIVRGTK